MTELFPLRPDYDWYDGMIARYGGAIPAIEHFQIRRGLQAIVGDFFAQLHDRDLLRRVDIQSILTRNAGFVVIDARGHLGLPYGDYGAVDALISETQTRLSETCEHCGKPGEIVAKIGLEALVDDRDAVLGNRFLCAECYESWSPSR